MVKFSVKTKELRLCLMIANGVVEKRNAIAQLANVKIEALTRSVRISATNMDICFEQEVEAEVIESGAIAVNAKTLLDIVSRISDEKVVFSNIAEDGGSQFLKNFMLSESSHDTTTDLLNTENRIKIKGKNCEFSLPLIAVEEFPVISKLKSTNTFSVECGTLMKAIDSTIFAVSSNETYYNLNGMFVHTKGNVLCVATTDAHRLATCFITDKNLNAQNNANNGVLVPLKTVSELSKI